MERKTMLSKVFCRCVGNAYFNFDHESGLFTQDGVRTVEENQFSSTNAYFEFALLNGRF